MFEKDEIRLEAILSKQVPKREVTWTIKDTKLGESLKYSQEYEKESNKHILIVRDCTLLDAGEYTINVRKNKQTANVTVKGKISSI